jgi:hypothetical protein
VVPVAILPLSLRGKHVRRKELPPVEREKADEESEHPYPVADGHRAVRVYVTGHGSGKGQVEREDLIPAHIRDEETGVAGDP